MAWLPSWLQPWPALSEDARQGETSQAGVNAGRSEAFKRIADDGAELYAEKEEEEEERRRRRREKEKEEEEEEYFYRHGPSLAIPMTGATLGFVAGFYTSVKRAGLVFMAENAHRRPDTVQGWYFYNKTKNYKVLLAGARGGAKTAIRVAAWTTAYVTVEETVERLRQRRLALSSAAASAWWNGRWIDGAAAGGSIAIGASVLYRLARPVAQRVVAAGILTGASVGALRQVQSRLADRQIEEARAAAAAAEVASA